MTAATKRDGDEVFEPTEGTPESFGWTRIPRLDTKNGVAYERPDGVLQLLPKGQKVVLYRSPKQSLT